MNEERADSSATTNSPAAALKRIFSLGLGLVTLLSLFFWELSSLAVVSVRCAILALLSPALGNYSCSLSMQHWDYSLSDYLSS